VAIVSISREEAAKVLVETDAGFFGDAGRVGIDSPKKALNLMLDLGLLSARWGDLAWLDLIVHFRFHS
jgi:hypothetical protein